MRQGPSYGVEVWSILSLWNEKSPGVFANFSRRFDFMIPFEEASEQRSGLLRTEQAVCQLDLERNCHRGVVEGRLVKECKVNKEPHRNLEERCSFLMTKMPKPQESSHPSQDAQESAADEAQNQGTDPREDVGGIDGEDRGDSVKCRTSSHDRARAEEDRQAQ